MRAYFEVYSSGFRSGWIQASFLGVSHWLRLKNAAKGANLALCFAGYIPVGESRLLGRCADISALAATFDLLTDGVGYCSDLRTRFSELCSSLLEADTCALLDELLLAKKNKSLKNSGLERGVYAVEIILAHLDSRTYWDKRVSISQLGIMCQIADDVLDLGRDLESDHLNFLKSEDGHLYLQRFVRWNFRDDLSHGAYPLVLKAVIGYTQWRAERILNSRTKSHANQASINIRIQSSEIANSRSIPEK